MGGTFDKIPSLCYDEEDSEEDDLAPVVQAGGSDFASIITAFEEVPYNVYCSITPIICCFIGFVFFGADATFFITELITRGRNPYYIALSIVCVVFSVVFFFFFCSLLHRWYNYPEQRNQSPLSFVVGTAPQNISTKQATNQPSSHHAPPERAASLSLAGPPPVCTSDSSKLSSTGTMTPHGAQFTQWQSLSGTSHRATAQPSTLPPGEPILRRILAQQLASSSRTPTVQYLASHPQGTGLPQWGSFGAGLLSPGTTQPELSMTQYAREGMSADPVAGSSMPHSQSLPNIGSPHLQSATPALSPRGGVQTRGRRAQEQNSTTSTRVRTRSRTSAQQQTPPKLRDSEPRRQRKSSSKKKK